MANFNKINTDKIPDARDIGTKKKGRDRDTVTEEIKDILNRAGIIPTKKEQFAQKRTIFNNTEANKKMQNDMDKLVKNLPKEELDQKEKNMEKIQPKSEDPSVAKNHSEARLSIINDRQTELTDKNDIASKEELVELLKEQASLEGRIKEKAMLEATESLGVVERTDGTNEEHNVLQEEDTPAVFRTGRQNKEGLIGAKEIKETPKEVRNEVLDNTKKTSEHQEEGVEKIRERLEKMSEAVDERAKKAGVLDFVRKQGEVWKKIPLRYKVLLSAGLMVSGIGSVALGATVATSAVAGITIGLRALGGMASFVTFEKLLENGSRDKNNGKERTGSEQMRHTALAATLSILIAGLVPGILRDNFGQIIADKIHGVIGGFGSANTVGIIGNLHEVTAVSGVPSNTGVSPASSVLNVSSVAGGAVGSNGITANGADSLNASALAGTAEATYIQTVESGDSVWKITENQLEKTYPNFAQLEEGQRTYIIDAIKNKIAENPTLYGIESGNIDIIHPEEEIDFSKILADKEFMVSQFSDAVNLNQEEITNIENYVPASVDIPTNTIETPTGTVSLDTFAPIDKTGIFAPPKILTVNEIASTVRVGDNGANLAQNNGLTSKLNSEFIGKFLDEGQARAYAKRIEEAITSGNSKELFRLEKQIGMSSDDIVSLLKGNGAVLTPENLKTIDGAKILDIQASISSGNTTQVTPETQTTPKYTEATVPNNPNITALAGDQVHRDVNNLFGKSGFLGFGAVDGMQSPNWTDAKLGFANKTVFDVTTINPENNNGVGINNKDATIKMVNYITELITKSGVIADNKITVAEYIKKANEAIINKATNK